MKEVSLGSNIFNRGKPWSQNMTLFWQGHIFPRRTFFMSWTTPPSYDWDCLYDVNFTIK